MYLTFSVFTKLRIFYQLEKGNILIADDEVHTLISLAFVLESAGYEVITATDGQEAYYKIREAIKKNHPIDLLILDFEMPRLNGLQLVKKMEKHGMSMPCIFISGSFKSKIKNRLLEKDNIYLLVKPLEPDNVLNTVSKILHNKKNHRKIA